MNLSISNDLEYLAIFTLVLILPKLLLRFRLPSGITALLIGILFTTIDPSIKDDRLFRFLSQIGITSLFLFAGLEVDFEELKSDGKYLSKYILKSLAVILIMVFGLSQFFELSYPSATILALGIFTPSAGFIMNSLHSFKMGEDQEYWVKSKAISKELLSVVLLFIALQGHDIKSMLISLAFFAGLFAFLPFIFKLYFRFISPYAPNSEIPFLVVLSLTAGVVSKELGTYYLVGAFIVGLIGSRFKHKIFKDDEKMLFSALAGFFNVFLPFYFFQAGLKISVGEVTLDSFTLGVIFIVIFVPLRIILTSSSLKYVLKEFINKPYQISLSLMPTLIFGLVAAGALRAKGEVETNLIYALIFYTLISSLLPSIFFSLKRDKTTSVEQ
ncbi:cation:proton antiporter [Halobacteriovorax sp.]|uniref:cation:proton antiporter n=1 Tax=Halobacteriovorax sp. TaxID=2020862 RepID=UPI0035677A73